MKQNSEPKQSYSNFPKGVERAVQLTSLIRQERPLPLANKLSSRLVQIAQQLPEGEFIGLQTIISPERLTQFICFGSANVDQSDLEWVVAETADAEHLPLDAVDDFFWKDNYLYGLVMPVAEYNTSHSVGFGISPESKTIPGNTGNYSWILHFSEQGKALMEELRKNGAILRYVVSSALLEEQRECNRHTEQTWKSFQLQVEEYVGIPVRVYMQVRLPKPPSVSLRAIFNACIPGIELRAISDEGVWDNPLDSAIVLPDYAARILVLEPEVRWEQPILGIKARNPIAKLRPICHEDSAKRSVVIGKALDISGEEREVKLSEIDARRHLQLIGQTGTGKSTVLSQFICSAMENDFGLTFLDLHGSTIDAVLRLASRNYVEHIRVMRVGDKENPVPLNMWNTDDPKVAERPISDMNLLFGQVYDPNSEGIVGPRFERIFSIIAQSTIALFGQMASFEVMLILLMNRDYLRNLAEAIRPKYPDLAQSLMTELVNNRSNEYNDLVSWIACKLQRLNSVEQLRNILGAGANALSFAETIDTKAVTLIDLGMPSIGTHAARIIGELILQQFYAAALERKDTSKTHFFIIDEGQLFQTETLSQMFAGIRKFGVSIIFAHQDNQQLTHKTREGVNANTANFISFRLSVKDAAYVVNRFDDSQMCQELPRLDAFNAIATISVDGKQSPAFTLQIEKPEFPPDAEATARLIEEQSIRTLVEPYRNDRALTKEEIRHIFNDPKKYLRERHYGNLSDNEEDYQGQQDETPGGVEGQSLCQRSKTPNYIKQMISSI